MQMCLKLPPGPECMGWPCFPQLVFHWGGGGVIVFAEGNGALCCVVNMGTVVTIFLSVAIYNFVLYFINGPFMILTPY